MIDNNIPLRERLKQSYELYLAQRENAELKRKVIDTSRAELQVTNGRPNIMSHAETDGDLDLLEFDD